MKYRKEAVSQLTLTTTGKCFNTQSKYFFEMLTGSLPEMLRDKCCLLSLPVFPNLCRNNTEIIGTGRDRLTGLVMVTPVRDLQA